MTPAIGTIEFVCWYEDYAATCKLAREHGWKGKDDDSPVSVVDPVISQRSFPTLDAALKYAGQVIDKTCFGVATVRRRQYRADRVTPDVIEWKDEHEWLVSRDGVDEDHPIDQFG